MKQEWAISEAQVGEAKRLPVSQGSTLVRWSEMETTRACRGAHTIRGCPRRYKHQYSSNPPTLTARRLYSYAWHANLQAQRKVTRG
jgi:hypothetical protein